MKLFSRKFSLEIILINSYFSSDTIKQKETQVPQGHIWVEGDNKRASYDSRHFGYVSERDNFKNDQLFHRIFRLLED
jgi:hypothetical protein